MHWTDNNTLLIGEWKAAQVQGNEDGFVVLTGLPGIPYVSRRQYETLSEARESAERVAAHWIKQAGLTQKFKGEVA
jgi:hypothetical protein